jgi:hypothetical protein
MKKVILLLFFVIGCILINAQETVLVSGGNATGSGGSVSYSVGQILYNTYSGTNGTVAQGVQQPYEISLITGIKEAKDISLEIVVYPNPATDFVKLNIKNYEIQNLRFQLYDNNGSLLQDKKIESSETNILMGSFVPSIYFLKITDNNKTFKTFKIIKK